MATLAEFLAGFNRSLLPGVNVGRQISDSAQARRLNDARISQIQNTIDQQRRAQLQRESDQQIFAEIMDPMGAKKQDDANLMSLVSDVKSIAGNPSKIFRTEQFKILEPKLKEAYGDNISNVLKAAVSSNEPEERANAVNTIESLISETPGLTGQTLAALNNDPSRLVAAVGEIGAGTESGRQLNPNKARLNAAQQRLDDLQSLQGRMLASASRVNDQDRLNQALQRVNAMITNQRQIVADLQPDISGEGLAARIGDQVVPAKFVDGRPVHAVTDEPLPANAQIFRPRVEAQTVEGATGVLGSDSQQFDVAEELGGTLVFADDLIDSASRLIEIGSNDPAALELQGFATNVKNAVSFTKGLLSQANIFTVNNAGEQTSLEQQLSNEQVENRLTRIAGNDAVARSITISLAYRIARINDDKGRISDADLLNAMREIGGDVRTPANREKVLRNVVDRKITKMISQVRSKIISKTVSEQDGKKFINELRAKREDFMKGRNPSGQRPQGVPQDAVQIGTLQSGARVFQMGDGSIKVLDQGE